MDGGALQVPSMAGYMFVRVWEREKIVVRISQGRRR